MRGFWVPVRLIVHFIDCELLSQQLQHKTTGKLPCRNQRWTSSDCARELECIEGTKQESAAQNQWHYAALAALSWDRRLNGHLRAKRFCKSLKTWKHSSCKDSMQVGNVCVNLFVWSESVSLTRLTLYAEYLDKVLNSAHEAPRLECAGLALRCWWPWNRKCWRCSKASRWRFFLQGCKSAENEPAMVLLCADLTQVFF